jgi:hypothetical protein
LSPGTPQIALVASGRPRRNTVHRRTAALAVLVAAWSLLLPTAVLAAGASLRGPADGVVDGPTSLDLRVTREAFEAITAIDVGLRRGGAQVDGTRAQRLCEGFSDCPNGQRSADYRIPFDPRTGAPFLPEESARILPNGPHELRVSIQVGRDVQERSLELTLSVPPSAVTDVRATAEDQVVALRWSKAPEPDVAGYRVERASDQGGWSPVADLAPSASSFADDPEPGTFRYRLVTLRPDGKGGSYEVTSKDVRVTVAARPAEDGGDARGDGGGDGEAPGSVTDGDEDPDGLDDLDAVDAESSEDLAGDDEPSSRAATGTAANRTARTGLQAPSFDRGGASTPALPWDDPDFFQETLDYDDPVAAERAGGEDRGEVLLSIPGMGALSGGLDAHRAAVPVAGGLLMTTVGLHLWRWLKVPLP